MDVLYGVTTHAMDCDERVVFLVGDPLASAWPIEAHLMNRDELVVSLVGDPLASAWLLRCGSRASLRECVAHIGRASALSLCELPR